MRRRAAAIGHLNACITRNFDKLAEPCQAALVRIAAVRAACAADIARHCPATRPGGGRLLFCVKAQYTELSDGCRDAIGRAAKRNLRSR